MSWWKILKDDEDPDDDGSGQKTKCRECRKKGYRNCYCPPDYDEDYVDYEGAG